MENTDFDVVDAEIVTDTPELTEPEIPVEVPAEAADSFKEAIGEGLAVKTGKLIKIKVRGHKVKVDPVVLNDPELLLMMGADEGSADFADMVAAVRLARRFVGADVLRAIIADERKKGTVDSGLILEVLFEAFTALGEKAQAAKN